MASVLIIVYSTFAMLLVENYINDCEFVKSYVENTVGPFSWKLCNL